jgi:geranylgeranyl diphosphate synthase type I
MSVNDPIISIAAALEMFHAAALVHDDLLDQSDTRRGKPAIHKRFEQMHKNHGFAGSPERFGVAGSVLVGDMMLSWSSELFGEALLHSPTEAIEAACRIEFSKMRFEVMAGQYLDVLEENAAPIRDKSEAVARANRVMLYKTAKYSLEAPLLIGSSLAGAGLEEKKGLSDFGIPLGLAFQLRDDVLGVFGDPEVTGKPAGDDLREGKRTVLTGLTLQSVPQGVARAFEELLTSGELGDEQIEFMRQTIRESGALDKTERLIEQYSTRAIEALANLEISDQGRRELANLTDAVINRSK